MDKTRTVALMAATIYGSIPPTQRGPDRQEVSPGRIAAQAWALYEAVEQEAAERHSRR